MEDTEVLFDQALNIITGANAQGKTTLANALRLTFTQRAGKTTDKKGTGAMDNVRLGAKKAEIVTAVSTAKGMFQIVTQYGPGASRRNQTIKACQGKEGEPSPAPAFEGWLERQSEALSCCLDSDYFFNPKTEQKDILAALILPASYEFMPAQVVIDEQKVWEESGAKPDPNRYSAQDLQNRRDMALLAEKHLGKFVWEKSPVAVIDQVYSAAYDGRKNAKVTLGSIYIPQQPVRPEFDAGHVQEKIDHFRALAGKEAKKIKGGGSTQVGKVEQQLEQENAKMTTARADYAAAIRRRGELEQAMLDEPNVKKAQRTAAGRTLFNQLQEQIDALDGEISEQSDAQTIWQELLQNESGSPVDHANCPTCTQQITRKFVDARIAELQKLIDNAEAGKLNLMGEQNGLGDIVGAEAIVKKYAEQTSEKLQAVKDVADATGRITTFETSVKGLAASLASAKASASESAPADTTALDAANTELSAWEKLLSPALNYESTLKQIDEATKRQQDQKEKVTDLETLCAYFGDKGIKADLIAQGSEKFIGTVNAVLSKWGYEAKLSPEADAFTVRVPRGWLPTKQLSGFEELMFKAALQCSIAVHSKIKMVIVDEAQTMIDDQRVKLFKAIQGMLDEKLLDRAFIILADKRDSAPVRAEVAYFKVEDGKVTRL